MRTPEAAIAAARRYTTYRQGWCLHFTQTVFDAPHRYPHATAQANAVHLYGGTPPAGVPVFWTGGSHGYGHAAISVGGGRIRSTDCPSPGRVGDTDLGFPARAWGLHYVGWSKNLGGVDIPGIGAAPAPSPSPGGGGAWSSGEVWRSRLTPGQRSSDSVRRLQTVLNAWSFRGGKELPITGNYGPMTAAEVAKFQTQVCGDPGDGDIGPKQAERLFTKLGPWTFRD